MKEMRIIRVRDSADIKYQGNTQSKMKRAKLVNSYDIIIILNRFKNIFFILEIINIYNNK